MASSQDWAAELRQIIDTLQRRVDEQIELGVSERRVPDIVETRPFEPTTVDSHPRSSPTARDAHDGAYTGQGMLQIPIQPGPFDQFDLDSLDREASACTRCPLSVTRTKVVFGVGNPAADLMFVGEGPGHDEDIRGEPFVGRAGQLLTKIIEAMGVARADVYICNVVKCRPPENRNPLQEEVDKCRPFLMRQIDLVQPKVIVALGNVAVQFLLESTERISRMRGRFHDLRGTKVMPTYHPAFLLRNPNAKREVWDDMKVVMAELGLSPAEA